MDKLTEILLSDAGVTVIKAMIVYFAILMTVPVMVYVERRGAGLIQDRLGPNRVGPFGLIQPFADMVKLMFKEEFTPFKANRLLYLVAPALALIPAGMTFAVIPFGTEITIGGITIPLRAADLNVGILYIVAIGTFHALAVLVAGWGSNNKFSLLSSFRVVNQLLIYEIPMVLCILVVVLFSKTMSTQGIVEAQTVPYFIVMPVVALIFLICALAEANRSPVDLLEADSEMVAGYMVEYSGMKFAMFFIAEYVNMFATGIIFATLFLGGWKFFGLEDAAPVFAPMIVFFKSAFVIFLMLWFRATYPRMRFDHLVGFAWKFLVPLALVNLLLGAIVVKVTGDVWGQAGLMLVGNIVIIVVTFIIVNRVTRNLKDAPALKSIAAVER